MTKPNPQQPDRCPSIDPYDTLQCARRIHDDDQCQFGGIAWKKGTPPHESAKRRMPAEKQMKRTTLARYDQHHPWGPLEAALVSTIVEWRVETEMRPTFGPGSDCSDLMDAALTRIKGLCSGALDPDAVMEEIG